LFFCATWTSTHVAAACHDGFAVYSCVVLLYSAYVAVLLIYSREHARLIMSSGCLVCRTFNITYKECRVWHQLCHLRSAVVSESADLYTCAVLQTVTDRWQKLHSSWTLRGRGTVCQSKL